MKTESVFVCGDFNVTLDPTLDRSGDRESHPESQRALQLLILEHSLVDSFRKTNGNEIMFTWSRDNSVSRLDRIYCSSHISNRLVYSSIVRCPYSDHDAFCTAIMATKVKQGSAFWHFNVSLLSDKKYSKLIHLFWEKWQLMRGDYDDIRVWWDIGKIKIKELTQQYSIGLKNSILDNKVNLEQKIKYFEAELISKRSDIVFNNLKQCKVELESITKNESQGALIRSRFNIINKIDKGTSFFFDLERTNAKSKQLTHMILDNGKVIDNEVDISEYIREYYSDLFTPGTIEKGEQHILLSGLEQLSEDHKSMCGEGFTFNELTIAMHSLSINKSPGLDGLPVNFFSHFWEILGHDLYDVILYSIEQGELPLSCRRAIVSLLPRG